ncbi:MAG: helix-turn-helix domain-containing protein [Christensenellales bacterium]|jgi:AraC-like DNA-binding protein
MFFSICLNAPRRVVAANRHYYGQPTEPLYLNRTLQYHDLIYLAEGKWTFTENDTDYPVEKGDVLLLSAGHHHYTRFPCAAGTRTICIHITREAADDGKGKGCLLLPPRLNARGNASVKRAFETIVHDFWMDKPHRQERLNAELNMLFLYLSDLSAETDVPNAGGLGEAIVRLITDHPHMRFKCVDVALRYGVSTKTIEATMRRYTGMPFAKYQNHRKVEMAAAHMKVEPDVRLAEIARLFGFYDEFHLSRTFKQFYGVSPSLYRKMNNTEV